MKVLAGGTFNNIHKGHVFFISECKKLGDFLVIVIANDSTVLKRKKLLRNAEKRKESVESLGIADSVIIGNEKNHLEIIEKERPDIIALGYDQKMPGLEEKTKELGLKIIRIKKLEGYSTRANIR
ncbi:MAG: adenylyltransferase/cytidyltransferase family protein [Candidatus Aenigmarchaeota archaeon]|nr:adenylyltransferase/cytidyltransferase family protein [Candidatus Aenigmarchaeota archaeon]